jgi:heme-degrading monooxygenase HmoA
MAASCSAPTAPSRWTSEVIYEHAHLVIKKGDEDAFEKAFLAARPILESAPGCHTAELFRSADVHATYLLRVGWNRVTDHVDIFPTTPQAARFAEHVAKYFDTAPTVTHVESHAVT